MSNHEVRGWDDSDWCIPIAHRVAELIQDSNVHSRFSRKLYEWASKKQRDGVVELPPRCGVFLSLCEKYAVMAAIYNTHCEAGKTITIWKHKRKHNRNSKYEPNVRDEQYYRWLAYRKREIRFAVLTRIRVPNLTISEESLVTNWLRDIENDLINIGILDDALDITVRKPDNLNFQNTQESKSSSNNTKACTENTDSEFNSREDNDLWNNLNDRQRYALEVLLESEAFDAEKRLTTGQITAKAEGDVNPDNYKESLSKLVSKGLATSKTGREGGYWLTAEGLATIQYRKNNTTDSSHSQ